LIETDGTVYEGAEAVFRALTYARYQSWAFWMYESVPGFAAVTEWMYQFVAGQRELFSWLTRVFWGADPSPPDYLLSRWVFLRFLGVIYLIAFVSLGAQVDGLIGSEGISPAAQRMEGWRQQFDQAGIGLERYHQLPTLCWLNASDNSMRLQWIMGVVLSMLLIGNIAPAPCLFLLWTIYLSLAVVCGEFLGFQWDNLLLEVGFLAIFLAPWQLRPRIRDRVAPSKLMRWLIWWLLFRLMLESGLVKLLSGDTTWRNLTALNFHYETQPLPTWIGWYAHQLPEGIQKASVAVMFFIEVLVPFLIFAPRRLRFVGCGLMILLQVAILLTGNYCFFNLLTIAMCLLLLDDAAWRKIIFARLRKKLLPGMSGPKVVVKTNPSKLRAWPVWVTAPVAAVILLVTTTQLFYLQRPFNDWPGISQAIFEWIYPFRSANTYGLFMVMTTRRPEIVIEGSNDGQNWKAYEFRFKPGDLKHRPQFVAPHQPRLDWQMWFAALDDSPDRYRRNYWLRNFCVRLLEGSPAVLELMGQNPFPEAPPKYVRAVVYDYQFTNFKERRADGAWWRREFKGEY
jgi:hypothetical protein